MTFRNLLAFWRLRRAARPARPFKRALWKSLEARLAERRVAGPVWYRAHWFRASVASASSLAVCASFATGAYAYSSPQVTEGTALYPVKRQIESVEEGLQKTPEAKAAFYLKKIERRESEAAVLRTRQQKAAQTEREIRATERQLEDVSRQLDAAAPGTATLREQVRSKLEQRQKNLQKRERQLELRQRKERLENDL